MKFWAPPSGWGCRGRRSRRSAGPGPVSSGRIQMPLRLLVATVGAADQRAAGDVVLAERVEVARDRRLGRGGAAGERDDRRW